MDITMEPFFGISDEVIGETTCYGKKKMFELIRDNKPMFVRVESGTHAELISDMSQLPMFGGMIVGCITRHGDDIVKILDTADAINNGELRLEKYEAHLF